MPQAPFFEKFRSVLLQPSDDGTKALGVDEKLARKDIAELAAEAL
jgi:hypothetical protein